jgi:hypothetical protein
MRPRSAGLSLTLRVCDEVRVIVEIVAAVALMRYTTTLASALGVPLERAMEGIGVSCGVPRERRDG